MIPTAYQGRPIDSRRLELRAEFRQIGEYKNQKSGRCDSPKSLSHNGDTHLKMWEGWFLRMTCQETSRSARHPW